MMITELPSKRLKFSLKIEPILSPTVSKPIKAVDLCVLHLHDKRNVPKLLKILPDLPISLSHLKRINKDGRMIVHEKSVVPNGTLLQEIREIEKPDPEFSIVSVPRSKPKTRTQFEMATKLWPTNFYEDKKLESLLNSTYFTGIEQESIASLFFRAQNIGGCVVYDPINQNIVIESSGDDKLPNGHPVMLAVNFLCKKTREDDSNKNLAQYLATGYDFYLNSEPCAMCSMALVHMRVRRVFFGQLNPESGALLSHFQLHLKPEINHHYEVFRITNVDS